MPKPKLHTMASVDPEELRLLRELEMVAEDARRWLQSTRDGDATAAF